jgi:hypothetical protein
MSMSTGPTAGNWPVTPQPFTPPPPMRPVRKPATVAATLWLSVAVGVLTAAGALIMIVSGKDSIRAYVEKSVSDTLGSSVDPALITATVGSELDSAYDKLVTKAVVAIVVAVLILAFSVVARNASTGGRVGLTIVLIAGMWAGSGLQLADMDVLPKASIAIAALTPLLSLIAIVCAFLPGTNAYAMARKAVR